MSKTLCTLYVYLYPCLHLLWRVGVVYSHAVFLFVPLWRGEGWLGFIDRQGIVRALYSHVLIISHISHSLWGASIYCLLSLAHSTHIRGVITVLEKASLVSLSVDGTGL